ncbi:DUF3883 domain-containing protein [[Clostridium] fimetarium]|uniref:Protein NO VEIN C-terminal domain-containing protein n=1 Tax=[Clostridium] fimetarium TaxID=99656 RepID=A0A1I0Q0W5_9FIRM|nr:DUF3883 domain-containing protein [[Clostridium] fimetarium]SEW20503.1 protein of unknown function [[Clostridium] fimetarium]
MNDKVTCAIETMKKGYVLDPNRILADYRKETDEIRGYHGRELLELLQNAVDELGGTKDRFVSIVLKDNVLTISNNGNAFTFEGFISLMYSNLSPKHNKDEYIGNKGTGFRSILNWADSVRIYSGDLSVEFSEFYARETLLELLENVGVSEFRKKHDDVRLATLVAPRLISPLQNKEYDTVIEVELKSDVVDRVIGQLKQINSKTLLFLEKLEKLTIEYFREVFVYEKAPSERENSICDIQITTKRNGKIVETDNWSILSREGVFEKQKYGVMVAYKKDMSVMPDVLYSYFKTKVQFPVHALIHATFDLNADRNHLVETEANKHILKVVCDTLVELALLTNSENVNYAPLTLLSTIGDFPIDLSWDNFTIKNYYLEAVAVSKVFPTVDNKYISFTEKPRFYDSNIADFLCGNVFSTLMPPTDNSAIRAMLKSIAKHRKVSMRYQCSEITTGINSVLSSLQISERAALWLVFISEYRNEISEENKPHFILDSSGNTVIDGQQVFLPAENVEFSSPPDFTKIVFMNKDLVSALRDMQGKESTLRGLANELSRFNIREYNIANIINAVISRLRNRVHQTSKKTRGCYEDTIEWLWKLWKANVLKNEMSALTTIPLINRSGAVKNANELYFGQEFGNEVTDNLFMDNDDLFVALPRRIVLTELTKQQYKEFLSALGVAYFPRKTKLKIYPVLDAYRELIYTSIRKYPLLAEDNCYHNEQELRSASFSYVEIATVERLDEIFKEANTKSIIDWIRQDESIRQLLSDYEPSTSRAYVYNLYQQKVRAISGEQLASHLRFVFATSKWIEIDGIRYSPKQCLLVNKIDTLFAPIVVAPNLDLLIDNHNRRISEINAVQNVLEQIGAASDFSGLDTETFYSLLMALPETDESGEISKALYTSILKSGGLKNFNPNNAKRREYLQNGRVFCKSSKTYMAIKYVHYLTEKTVSREILKGFNLIAIPSRQSQENIKRYFGVLPLKIKGSIIGEPTIHPESVDFEQDFNDFICYAFCSRVDAAKQSEISTVKALRVRLCTNITADYGKGEIILAESSYIRGKNCVYVQAPRNGGHLKQLKSNVDFCSAIAELFITAIDIQDDTLFGYVRSLYEKELHNRNALILHDFDDLSILERSRDALNRTQSEKEMFLSACVLIAGENSIASIETDIESINFTDFNSTANVVTLIDILQTLQIDVDEFNEKSEIIIDLSPFYLECLHKRANDENDSYKNGLFAMLKSEPISKQRTFIKQLDKYRTFVFNPLNSIYYDWKAEFTQQFGSVISFASEENADTVWKTYRDIFVQNKDMSIVNDMLVDSEQESLLYFGKLDELDKAYNARKADIVNVQAKESKILSTTYATTIPIILVDVVAPSNNTVNNPGSSSRTGSRMAGMKRERNISEWGAFAEKLVYEQMKSNFLKVLWVSENAKKEGINPDGIGGLGYDLKYSNEKGEIVYVEIKSTAGTGISFVITENELNFAEEHPQQYEVVLVTAVMSDVERKIYRLADLFYYADGEERFCNSKFGIIGDSYTIRCQFYTQLGG